MELREVLWRQFGATIESLDRAIVACPDELWADEDRNPQYWYLVYHTLFWLDCYLCEPGDEFTPPAPFTLCEMDPAGVLPDHVYTKAEMQKYLEFGRAKVRTLLQGLSDARAQEPRRFGSVDGTLTESLIYNLRHVQHHTAQLNLILRQETDSAPGWVGKATTELGTLSHTEERP
jgi:DinB superfamily